MIAEHGPRRNDSPRNSPRSSPTHSPKEDRAHARRGSLLHTLKAVGWGLIGIRGRGGHESDIAKLNPLHLIVIAILCVAAFIGILLLLVRLAVGSA